ncbi:MAG: hypothetical protein GY928_37435 [Colwellia sp.]|nr:hypothetical protein [Colwellia sp.]
MREILFRAKRVDNGEWVEGFYWFDKNVLCNIDGHFIFTPYVIEDKRNFEVDPETIGQYTNLKDKNGVKVFEGDVCGYTVFDHNDNDEQFTGKVSFSGTRFIISQIPDKFNNGKYGLDLDWIASQDDEVEIIGNIHK